MLKQDTKQTLLDAGEKENIVSGSSTSVETALKSDAHGVDRRTTVNTLNRDKPPENVYLETFSAAPTVAKIKSIGQNVVFNNQNAYSMDSNGKNAQNETRCEQVKPKTGATVTHLLAIAAQRFSQGAFDLFFKCILAVLYCFFVVFRFFEYNYNTTKLKFLSLIYNPSNSPQLIRSDVTSLAKLPKRLAAILEYKSEEEIGGGVVGLMENSSDIVAWSLSAGIKHLILYDHDGFLKNEVTLLRRILYSKLCKYYGSARVPKFAIRIPHSNEIFYNLPSSPLASEGEEEVIDRKVSIEIVLLSKVDGRATIVDLTKTMAELCKQGDLSEEDITLDLVDRELHKLVGEEPDLLLYFGPNLDLQGFPPWHLRLTELYWEHDNCGVSYTVFIRGLKAYSDCKVNVGK